MYKRTIQKTRQTSVVLPSDTIDNLDVLVDQTDSNRSEVMSKLLDYDLENKDILDTVFGKLENDEDDEEEEDDEED